MRVRWGRLRSLRLLRFAELADPRSLTLRDWDALEQFAAALVARSAGQSAGRGDVVEFTACTAARIGETSGVRRADIDLDK
jgi:integrase